MIAIIAIRDAFYASFNFRFEFFIQFKPVFQQIFQPIPQGFLVSFGQLLHFFLDAFECLHDEIKACLARFCKSNLVAGFQRADFFFGEGK
jgi:hypothetical protein